MGYLLLFTGKGGVGKSTIAAASAIHHATQGLRTLLVSSDPAHSTDDVLGIKVGSQPTKVSDSLWAKNLNAEELAADFFGQLQELMESSFGTLPGFDSSMLADLSNFPGMDEAFAMEEIERLCCSVDYDLIVFDTAPTGHTLKALSAPDYLNTFLLKVLRMKAKIEKVLLRNPDFVSINLISIPTEAGFGECLRTVRYLEGMKIPVQHLIINQIIPSFTPEVWEDAPNNPALALLKTEYDIQQPYLVRFKELSSDANLRLVGMTRLPFEPRSSRLSEVATTLWGERGLKFQIKPSLELDEKKLIVHVPFLSDAKWSKDNWTYRFEDIHFSIPLVKPDTQPRRRAKGDSVVITWK
jgi:anion-transporting  ArsA/GET3 family ATPase